MAIQNANTRQLQEVVKQERKDLKETTKGVKYPTS